MAGYFEDILESYRPADRAASVDAPWSDPIVDAPAPELPFADASAPVNTDSEAAPRAVPETSDADPLPEHLRASPDPIEATGHAPEAGPFEPAERIVERETRIVESTSDASPLPEPDEGAPSQEPTPDVHLHEHIDRSTTHLHEYLRIVENGGEFEPEPGDAEPPALPVQPPAPEPADAGREPALAAIEEAELARALARLHGEDGPPTPFVSPDDFEPEAHDNPTPPDIETVREVTREVVTEVHHHHTTETRVEPPAAPAPRTAAEASRIGPIRFASAWKTGGR